jgi:adenosine deaminase
MTFSALKAMPKIDLHRHLEGSLRLDTLAEIAIDHGLDLPGSDMDSLRPYVQVTDDPRTSANFLAKFEVLRHFYRSPEAVGRLTYEAIADAAADHVKYLELRFSPQALSRVQGFPLDEVCDWVIEAARQASQAYAIQVGLIVTLVRHEPPELARAVAEVAFQRADQGIVGIDLAGDEVNYPSHPFRSIFKEAKEVGLGITVHAGEWQGADAVRWAIEEMSADRIGHGVRAIEDPNVVRLVQERSVALEVCLTSNLHTGVVRHMSHHPLADLDEMGVRVTLNTDDPSISDSTLTDEYQVAMQTLGMTYGALRRLILNAASSAFLPEGKREKLVNQFKSELPEDD